MNRKSLTLAHELEHLYQRYNKRCYVSPDPLQFLYGYSRLQDRELVALVASSLAYGRVAMILNSVASVLKPLGPSPRTALEDLSEKDLVELYSPFRHRFTSGSDVIALLTAYRHATARRSLGASFAKQMKTGASFLEALDHMVASLEKGRANSLLARPQRGSSCKRHFLFLRWMVRRDAVDPGGWRGVDRSQLLVPLDTHLFRIASQLGLTKRKSADLKTTVEISEGFRQLRPDDPVRYDFVLTRFGIRRDFEHHELEGIRKRSVH